MANSNFVVHNGLTVGPLVIDAATGSITTPGDVSITGNLGVSQISKNDSSVSINDTGTGSTVVIKIDGATEQTVDANGVNLATGGYYSINGSSVLNATTLGSGVTASSLTSVGTLTGLTVSGTTALAGTTAGTLNATSGNIGTLAVTTGLGTANLVATGGSINNVAVGATTHTTGRFTTVTATTVNAGTIGNASAAFSGASATLTGTLIATTVNAGTIGNSGATLTGTLSTAAQTNITSVGTLTGLTVSGTTALGVLTTSSSTTIGGNLNVSGNLNVTGNISYFSSNDLVITDSLIYLADGNSGDVLDIGLVSAFTNPGYQHTGLVRDASDGVWKLFANVVAEPTTTVNFTFANYSPLRIGALTASSATLSGTIIASTVNAGTIGNTGATLTGTLSTASQTNITAVGTISTGTWSASFGAVSGANLTNLTATNINGTVATANVSLFETVASTSTNATFYPYLADKTDGNTAGFIASSFNINPSTGLVRTASLTSSGTIIASTVNAGTIGNSGATLTGTLSTAAQTNVTSVGTLSGLTVSGAIVPNANLTINVGSVSAWFNTFFGVSTQARYADLAENYQADRAYNPGTVLMFGGTQEVTVADAGTPAVAGVVSTNPAHLMNGQLSGANVVALALTGRVPCMVIGPVKKGDMMISAGFGYARSSANPAIGQVIGKALQDFPLESKGVIEVVVGRV